MSDFYSLPTCVRAYQLLHEVTKLLHEVTDDTRAPLDRIMRAARSGRAWGSASGPAQLKGTPERQWWRLCSGWRACWSSCDLTKMTATDDRVTE